MTATLDMLARMTEAAGPLWLAGFLVPLALLLGARRGMR